MQINKVKVMVILCIISVISITISYKISNKHNKSFDAVKLSELKKRQWLEEYKYIWEYLEQNSLILEALRNNGYDLEQLYKAYEIRISDCIDNKEYYICLNEFFAEFNGFAHLSILDYDFFKYSVEAYNNINSVAWSEVLTDERVTENYEIWGSIIKDDELRAMKDCSEPEKYITKSNMINNRSSISTINSKQQEYIETILKKYDITLSSIEQSNTKPSNRRSNNNEEVLISISESGNVIAIDVENDRTAYIKINSFSRKYIEDDKLMLDELYNKISDYSNLIIDITDNTGGSSYYWYNNIVMPNLKKDLSYTDYILYNITDKNKSFILETMQDSDELLLIDKLDEHVDINTIPDNILHGANYFMKSTNIFEKSHDEMFKGRIWVRIGRKVYSASESFTSFCKKTGFATLVGQETGGNGMGGDPAIFALPYSKLIVRYDMSYGLNPNGTDNLTYGTKPDIEID